MAITIQPSDILSQVAFRLHLPDFAAGEFVSQTQALLLLQNASERLTSMLLAAFGTDYFAQQFTVSTQAGVDTVSLPTDCATVNGVYWLYTSGTATSAIRLEHAPLLDEDLTSRAWDTPSGWFYSSRGPLNAPSYRIEGNVLVLRPVPSAVYQMRIDYQNTPSLAALSDVIYGQAGWKEWLILDVCSQIADREDKDISRWESKKAQVEDELKAAAENRDRNASYQARDVRNALSSRDQWRRRWYGR